MLARMSDGSDRLHAESAPGREESQQIATRSRVASGSAQQRRPADHQRTHRVKVLGQWDLLTVAGGRDQKLAAIAGAQRGRVARRQLLAVGITASMIQTMLVHRWLHRLHPGVYAVGHLAPIPWGNETAALLACPRGGLLSHESAAELWRIRPPQPSAPIHVTVTTHQIRRAGIRIHRSRALRPRDIRVREQLPVTAPARTLLDIAPDLSARELERALDEALVRRIVRLDEIAEILGRASGIRGAARLGSLIERHPGSTFTRSQAEERFLGLVRSAGLPEPLLNVRVEGFEVDSFWPGHRLVVEVDGYAYHATRSAFEHDRAKGSKLAAAGIATARVTWLQMEHEPYAVTARVAQALVRAEPRQTGA